MSKECGGQYTHAALCSVMAFAALGEGDKAGALFSMPNPIIVENPQGVSRGIVPQTLMGTPLSKHPLLIALRNEAWDYAVHVRLGS